MTGPFSLAAVTQIKDKKGAPENSVPERLLCILLYRYHNAAVIRINRTDTGSLQ